MKIIIKYLDNSTLNEEVLLLDNVVSFAEDITQKTITISLNNNTNIYEIQSIYNNKILSITVPIYNKEDKTRIITKYSNFKTFKYIYYDNKSQDNLFKLIFSE